MVDETGNYVRSCLNESMCREIAEAGDGAYIYVDNSSSAQDALNRQIDKLAKTRLQAVAFSEYNEKYQIFLLIGIVLLILDVLLLNRQNHYLKKITLFRDKTALILCLLSFSLLASSCHEDSERDHLRRGNRSYREAERDKVK